MFNGLEFYKGWSFTKANLNKIDRTLTYICETKLANALFEQKKQHYAPFSKLIKEMSIF